MKKQLHNFRNCITRALGVGLLTLGLGMPAAQSQNISATSYPITFGTGATLMTVPGVTTQHIGTGNDDTPGPLLPFGSGFIFTYGGVEYTSLSVSPDGFFRLGTAAAAQFTNDLASTTNTPIIAPFWDDVASGTNGQVRGFLTGTAPNRIYVIDWFVTIPRNTTGAASGNFQCWLYENGGKIEFVYGAGILAGQSSSVGHAITTGTPTRIASATINVPFTTSTNAYTASPNNANAAAIASGSKITYTPPVANAAPTALNFTGVTGNAITLNWTDNATNESFYVVQRSVDGGLNYVTLATLAANTATYTATGLLPGQLYTFRVIAGTEGSLASNIVGSQATLPPGIVTSTSAGGNWSSTSTWVSGVVPTASDSVIIVDGATVTIDSTSATCYAVVVGQGISGVLEFRAATAATLNAQHSVYIKPGGMFTAGTGTLTTHTLTVGVNSTTPSPGNIYNDGTLDFFGTAGANITFFGNVNGVVTGTGTFDFRRITLNKGNVSVNPPVLTLNAPYTVEGANTIGMIATHTAGILQIAGTFTQSSPVYNSTTYTIPLNGGIWLNNSNFTVTAMNGNPTLSGLLRISQGTYNISTVAGALLAPGTGSHLWVEGGVLNHSARIVSGNVFSFTMSGGVINVATVGNTTSNSASFGITSAASTINWTGGTVVLNQRSTGATIVDYNVAPLAGYNGGTLQIGSSATATNFDFRINGNTPKLTIDSITNNKTAVLRLQTNVRGTIYIPVGGTLNMNGQNLLLITDSVINNGFIDGRLAGSNFVFFAGSAQSLNGSGIDTVQTYANQNTAGGVLFNKAVVAYRANFFSATSFINSTNITMGNGLTQAVNVQIGVAGLTTAAGIFDVLPTFNLGTGTYSLIYAQEGVMRTTGMEIPASRSVFNLTIADTNNVTLAGGNLEVTGTLTLSAGRIVTSTSNLLIVSNTAAGAVTGGSSTSYVNGPLQRKLPASLTTASTYTFPVGKGATYGLFEMVNPGTSAAGTVEVLVERYNTSTGGTADGTSLNILTPQYWSVSLPTGGANLDSTAIRFTSASLVGINRVGFSTTLTGSYSSVSGGPGVGVILTNKLVGSTAVEGFFTIGEIIIPVSGTFLIGATKIAPDYTTLTAALTDLAGKQVQGNVTLLLDADYNSSLETFPISFNAFAANSAAHTITISPNTGVTASIIGSHGTALIRFTDNAKNYIFNGSNAGTNSRDLFIQNTNSAGAVVMFQGTVANQGVQNTTFKNTVVKGGGFSSAYGIIAGGTTVGTFSSGTGHKNLAIENNNIYNCNYAVVVSGTSATNKVTTVKLLNNFIGTDSVGLYNQTTGIYINNADSINVTGNLIKNVKTVSSINNSGITVEANTTNSFIRKNTINGIYSTSSGGWGAFGLLFNTPTGVDNITVSNNVISDVMTSNYTLSATTLYNAYGIRILGGNNLKFYYNTVHLFGQPTTGSGQSSSAALAIMTNSITGLDIRNNIFSNRMTGTITGSKHYALSTYGAVPGNIFDYNDFIQGSTLQGVLMTEYSTSTFVSTDVVTLANLKTSTAANNNSVNINPLFVNDSNLIIGLGTLQGLGTAIAGITTDIIDTIRATPPTIGAYEKGVDLSGPQIAYTAISNTSLITNRVLTGFATITDVSGVNTTTFKPRIYYRKSADANAFGTYPGDNSSAFNGWKYAEASNTTSPFNFTIDYSILFGGAPMSVGDTVLYFVVAQDMKSPAFNISANPAPGFSGTDVNTITAAPTTPNRFIIVDGPLAGTYLVGSTQTAPNFTTLTGAIGALNARGVSAPVVFELTDASYSISETFPLVINTINGGSTTNTFTIRPAALNVASITGSSATAIFTLNGASNVTIDGSNTIGGTTRDLTISNTSSAGTTAVIWNSSQGLGLGASRNTFKNCNLYNGSTSAANYGVFVGGLSISAPGADNDFITIQNDSIASAATPIAAIGTTAVSAGALDSLLITDNTMTYNGSATVIGIQVGNALNASVRKNRVDLQTSSTQITGISLEPGFLSSTVTRNNIVKVNTTSTGGYAGRGITVGTGSTTSNVTIANNFVSGVNGSNWSGFTNSSTMGIALGLIGNTGTFNTTTGGINIYYNTVNVYGSMGTASTTAITAALYIGASASDLNIRNNIFSNMQTATSTTQSNYAVYSAAANSAFITMDYNNYYVSNSFNAASAKIGWMGSDQITLANWKSATTKDNNSINDSTNFVSASDLHLTGSTLGNTLYVGSPVAGIAIDFDGDTRVALYPYIGADESTTNPLPVKLAAFTASNKSNDVLLNWTSVSELNNKGFEVQRSVDGRNFTNVGFVKGAGNSARTLNYSLTDVKAFDNAGSTVLYYRLKQVDFDGKFEFSHIVKVTKNAGETNALTVFPNPYSTDFTIAFNATNAGEAMVEIVDIQGKTVGTMSSQVISGNNTLALTEFAELNQGVYFIRLTVNGESQLLKLVKN